MRSLPVSRLLLVAAAATLSLAAYYVAPAPARHPPTVVSLPGFVLTSERAERVASVRINGYGYQLQLSPSGVLYAQFLRVLHGARSRPSLPEGVWIGRATRHPRPLAMARLAGDVPLGAEFLDDSTLLVLARRGDSLRLRRFDVAASEARVDERWSRVILPAASAHLAVDRASGRWAVAADAGDAIDSVLVARGDASGNASLVRRPRAHDERVMGVLADGGVLVARVGVLAGVRARLAPARLPGWSVRVLGDSGARAASTVRGIPQCTSASDAGRTLCIARSLDGAALLRDDGAGFDDIGLVPISYGAVRASDAHHVIAASAANLLVIDADARRARRVALDVDSTRDAGAPAIADGSWIAGADAAGATAVVARASHAGTTLSIYRIR